MGLKESNGPWVSIGLPVYNGDKYLVEAIESVLKQTYPNFELIIVDNASNDMTESISKSYAEADERIRYIRHSQNIGGAANFAFAAKSARYGIFTWLAHDDRLENGFLEETVAIMQQDESVALVATDFKIIDKDGVTLEVQSLAGLRAEIPWSQRFLKFYRYDIGNLFLCIYGVMRTDVAIAAMDSILQEVKLKFVNGVEIPFLARVAARGQIVAIPFLYRSWRLHDLSAFGAERAKLRERDGIRTRLAVFSHRVSLGVDQLQVIMGSNLKSNLKLQMLALRCIDFSEQVLSLCKSEVKIALKRLLGRSAVNRR